MPYKVKVRVKGQTGFCHAGHKVGDTFEFVGPVPNKPICSAAMTSIWPTVLGLEFGADFPFVRESEGKEVAFATCPDYENPVVFEISKEEQIDWT